jgi:hypothetical protein
VHRNGVGFRGWRVTSCLTKAATSAAILRDYGAGPERDIASLAAPPVPADDGIPRRITVNLRRRPARDKTTALSHTSSNVLANSAGLAAEAGA